MCVAVRKNEVTKIRPDGVGVGFEPNLAVWPVEFPFTRKRVALSRTSEKVRKRNFFLQVEKRYALLSFPRN